MTEAAASITITADPRKAIIVDLVGVKYSIMPPKVSAALQLGMNSANPDPDQARQMFNDLDEWILVAFGSEAPALHTRLKDPKDDLDLPHVMQLLKALVERTTANPTSSS